VGVLKPRCTTAEDLIRALTEAPRIKPTSTHCRSAWQPNPAEAPLIDAEILFRQSGPALPFEIGCYAILAGLMISGAIKRPGLVLLFTYVVLIVGVPLRLAMSHLVGDHVSFLENLAIQIFISFGSLLWPSFLIGIVLFQLRYYVPFSKTIAIGLVCVAIFVSAFGDATVLFSNSAVCPIILPLLG
jgi:hypothetical protein